MNSFILLKYQISCPPTCEELDKLPKAAVDIWYASVDRGSRLLGRMVTYGDISIAGTHDNIQQDRKDLIRLLEEYHESL